MGKLFWVVAAILLIGAFMVYSTYDLDFSKKGDKSTFFVKYSGWLIKTGNNVKDVTGYAIQQDWTPKDENNTETYVINE